MIRIYLILISLTIIGAFGGYSFKKASNSSEKIYLILTNKWLYIGGILYLLSAILNIYVLKFLPYTVVLPMTSITYIWTMLISYYLLNEKVSKRKICGVVFIFIGATLVGLD